MREGLPLWQLAYLRGGWPEVYRMWGAWLKAAIILGIIIFGAGYIADGVKVIADWGRAHHYDRP